MTLTWLGTAIELGDVTGLGDVTRLDDVTGLDVENNLVPTPVEFAAPLPQAASIVAVKKHENATAAKRWTLTMMIPREASYSVLNSISSLNLEGCIQTRLQSDSSPLP